MNSEKNSNFNNFSNFNDEQKFLIKELERKILKHYQEEHEAKIKYYTCEDSIENVKQTIARTQGDPEENVQIYFDELKRNNIEYCPIF